MSAPAPSPSKDTFSSDAFSADVFPQSDAFSTSDTASSDLTGSYRLHDKTVVLVVALKIHFTVFHR